MPQPPGEHTTTALRAASVRHLLDLAAAGTLTPEHIRTAATAHHVHPKTIRRWIANALTHSGQYTPTPRPRFTLNATMRDALARWGGNISAAHRELKAEGHLGSPPTPYATFHRAVTTEYSPGFLAGLRGGERDRRRFDVHAQRKRGFRNQAWEGDHVEASVYININGRRGKPWITWFIDCATDAICGMAITPHTPSRESILVALRDALLRGSPHSPFGGIPGLIRIDGGKDFLCRTVEQTLGAFGVRRVDLPPQHPELKGTVEAVNGAVKDMLFVSLPGYSEGANPTTGKRTDPDERLLTFEAFTALMRDWVHAWNTEHHIPNLGNRTPHQAWHEDLTLIHDVDPCDLHTFTLERHGRALLITGGGLNWDKRRYVAPWMHGHVGAKVHLRYMPHHLHQVECYDADNGRYLGAADLANALTEQQRNALYRGRRRQADRLKTALKKAQQNKKERFAAVTVPTAPRPLDHTTQDEAEAEIRALRSSDLNGEARPDLRRLPPPSPSWQTHSPAENHTGSDDATQSPKRPERKMPDPSPAWHRPAPPEPSGEPS